MSRHVTRANQQPAFEPSQDRRNHVVRSVEQALADELPDDGIVVVSAADAPPSAVTRLVQCHDGAENLVVVQHPTDISTGQAGALAGTGHPWAASATAIRAAQAHRPTSEPELRWLLWNDGAIVVRAGSPDARPTARSAPAEVLADRIPLPELRPADRREATAPTISWVIHGDADPEVLASLPASAMRPSEILLVTTDTTLPTEGRVRRLASVEDALTEARGAIVAFVHGHGQVQPDREAFARLLRRFDDPRVEVVQASYRTPRGVTRSDRGLLLADVQLPAPAFAAARRRVLRKDRGPLQAQWRAAVAREERRIVLSPAVEVPVSGPRAPIPTMDALRGLSGPEVRRSILSVISRDEASPSTEAMPQRQLSVGWVGFTGQDNFGDEVVLRAGRVLLHGLEVEPGGEGTIGTVLGGGTLLNAKRFYQRLAQTIDMPGHQHLILGTGVVSPEVAGWTEELEGWAPFLECEPVGVRGPHSATHLRDWGYRGDIQVLGDPALAINRPEGAQRTDRVLLAPIGRSQVGQVDDDWEDRQVRLLTEVGTALIAAGHPIGLFCAHPGDDRIALGLLRAWNDPAIPVTHAYRDLDGGIDALAAAHAVIGSRLHALVVAAAVGTPFVGLAYRPKIEDFAASVGADDQVGRLESLDTNGVLAMLETAIAMERRQAVDARVSELRAGLHAVGRAFVERATAVRSGA